MDKDDAIKAVQKLKSGKGFDLEDFKAQLQQMKKLGGLSSLVDKLPGAGKIGAGELAQGEIQMRRIEGIINSMTPKERRKPDLLKASRKRRIATGSGVQVQDVNRLLKPVRAGPEDDEVHGQGRPGQDDARHEGHDAGDVIPPGAGYGVGINSSDIGITKAKAPHLAMRRFWDLGSLAMTYFRRRSADYHWRWGVSRSCSGREGVGPPRYGRQT